jgi:hypothetical protein
MVYLDESNLDCGIEEDTDIWRNTCNCTSSWLTSRPSSCHSGDVDYAVNRWTEALGNG